MPNAAMSKEADLRAMREARLSPPAERAEAAQWRNEEMLKAVADGVAGDSCLMRELARSVGNSRRGRPLDADRQHTNRATQPWVKLGMSERTWYRRRRQPLKSPNGSA
jgi:hypothetical protein